MVTQNALIDELTQSQLKTDLPLIRVGDTLRVHHRIIEGEKERIQMFEGTVLARKGGGLSETISLHRVAFGEGMERVFLLHSPRIAKVEVIRNARVRRSKLYYLRGTTGKKAKLQAKIGTKVKKVSKTVEEPPAAAQSE